MSEARYPTLRERVTDFVTSELQVSVEDIYSRRRAQDLVTARALFVWLLRTYQLPLPEYATIGRWIGKHHSSVMNLYDIAHKRRLEDPQFEELCRKFAASLLRSGEAPRACG